MRRSWPTTNGSITGWANWDSTAYRRKAPPSETKQSRRIIAAPLIAAVVKTTGIVKIETIEPMIANKKAFQLALDELHILPRIQWLHRKGLYVD